MLLVVLFLVLMMMMVLVGLGGCQPEDAHGNGAQHQQVEAQTRSRSHAHLFHTFSVFFFRFVGRYDDDFRSSVALLRNRSPVESNILVTLNSHLLALHSTLPN